MPEKEQKKQIKTIRDILEADTIDVADWANRNFFTLLPITSIETPEELARASRLMAEATNNYAYLSGIISYVKIYKRAAKTAGDKGNANELIDKEDIIQRAIDAVKLKYSTISRMITAKQEINKEIHMSDST